MSSQDIREGMAVFDSTGRRTGHVESLREGHFFLVYEPTVPLVKERIVVNVADSVAGVDKDGVHLRHERLELLSRQMRPRESQSSVQVAPGEDVSSLHRGDEDRRPLDADDLREQRQEQEGRVGASPIPPR
jgi:hypothetical protein